MHCWLVSGEWRKHKTMHDKGNARDEAFDASDQANRQASKQAEMR